MTTKEAPSASDIGAAENKLTSISLPITPVMTSSILNEATGRNIYLKFKETTIPTRFIIGTMICLAIIIFAIIRSNMSIIILAMTEDPYDPSVELPDYGVRYPWTTYEQSLVISSYLWGNILICSIAGIFAERFGARYLIGFAFAFAAILSTVTPVAAQFLWLSILLRFLTGIAMGAVAPSLQALIANWAPPDERGKFLSLIVTNGIGTVIDWSMSGYIIEQYGWKYAFYVVSVIFAIFTVIWVMFVHDSPRKHPTITDNEREYILSKLSLTGATKKPWPPFRSIVQSVPFWALVCFYFGDAWGFYFLLTSIPRYFSEVHSLSITSAGLLSSVPYLVRVPCALVFGFAGDLLVKRSTVSTSAIRKIFSICSHVIPGCFLICISFVGDQPYTCLAFITIALCFNSSVVITSSHNSHDIAPNFASTIYGFITLFGFAAGYLASSLLAYVTREKSTKEEWQKVFFVAAGMYMGATIIFIIFGSGNVQKWNEVQDEVKPDDNKI